LTVWKITEPEEREDENDSTDDGSLVSTSTALPCIQFLMKDPSDVHRLESRNMIFMFHRVNKIKVRYQGVEFALHINKEKKPDLCV